MPSPIPSRMNGQRINQSVAPTYFMIAISLRRAKTVSRIVLEIMNTVAPSNSNIKITPKNRSRCVSSKRFAATSCPYLTSSTPYRSAIAAAVFLTSAAFVTVTRNEFGNGLDSPSASRIFLFSPSRSCKICNAFSRGTYSIAETLFMSRVIRSISLRPCSGRLSFM